LAVPLHTCLFIVLHTTGMFVQSTELMPLTDPLTACITAVGFPELIALARML
jgi:hypothetical protein